MRFEWITEWERIWSDEFQTRWLEWMERSENAHVFFHPAMAKAWIETYMPLRDIRPLFCIATEGENIIFLPLVLWKKNWKSAFLRTIVPVGYSDFDYHDPVVVGHCDWKSFWQELFDEIQSIYEGSFDIIEIDGIRRNIIGSGDKWSEIEVCPYIDLSTFADSESFLQSLKKNLRQDTKRRVRRLEENKDVTFHVFTENELSEALQTLPKLLEHHIKRWPNAYKAPHFHENLIKSLLPEGLLHFSKIAIGSKVISWRIGFIYKERYYSYMPAFDIEYNQYSPGKVHLFYCIDDAIRRGLKTYDQLRGAELYKNEWTNTVDAVWTYKSSSTKFSTQLKTKLIGLKNAARS